MRVGSCIRNLTLNIFAVATPNPIFNFLVIFTGIFYIHALCTYIYMYGMYDIFVNYMRFLVGDWYQVAYQVTSKANGKI